MKRATARDYVRSVNARTFCAHCGAQPIEWHNPEHVKQNRQIYRISSMVSRGSSITFVQAEMARCTPLCRKCHMKEDGRLSAFVVLKTRGERCASARLTEDDVRLLRQLRAQGMSYPALGRHFGIAHSAARKAAIGRTWRHVE